MENMEKEEIMGVIVSAAVELSDYLTIANCYVDEYCDNDRLRHVGLLLEKMQEHTDKLKNLFYEEKLYELIK